MDPGGVAAISRWLSAAIPPDPEGAQPMDPGGVAAMSIKLFGIIFDPGLFKQLDQFFPEGFPPVVLH